MIATMMVLSDISTAPTAAGSTIPHGANTPAARVAEIGNGDGFDPLANDSHGAVRKQFGELCERPLGLRGRPHFNPGAEHHDGDERRQLPPQI